MTVVRTFIPRPLRRGAALLGARCIVTALLAAILFPSLHSGAEELIAARIGAAAVLTAGSDGFSVVPFLPEKTSLREKRDVPNFWTPPRQDRRSGSVRHADVVSPAAGERESLTSHLIYTLTTSSRL